MEMNKWLEALRKACRMMNQNTSGDIERAYFWLVHKQRPKSVGNSEFIHLATAEADGWHMTMDVRMGIDGRFHETVSIDVFPSRDDGVNTFAEKAAVWLEELESMRGQL